MFFKEGFPLRPSPSSASSAVFPAPSGRPPQRTQRQPCQKNKRLWICGASKAPMSLDWSTWGTPNPGVQAAATRRSALTNRGPSGGQKLAWRHQGRPVIDSLWP